MNKLFIKKGNKYKEVGTYYDTTFINNGLTFSYENPYSRSSENIVYWLKDISKPIDVSLLLEIHKCKPELLQYLQHDMNDRAKNIQDIANEILEIIYHKLDRK